VIDGKKWDYDGSLVCISVVLRVIAVASHLSLLKTLCAVEHYVNDTNISKHGGDPLTDTGIGGNSADEDTCPEEDLTEIVGATAHFVKALGSDHIGTLLLLCGLLLICDSLKNKTEYRDRKAYCGNYKIDGCVVVTEEHGRNLCNVKNRNAYPNGSEDEYGHLLLAVLSEGVLCNVGLLEGDVLELSYEKEAGKAHAVSEEECGLNENYPKRSCRRVNKVHNENGDTAAGYRKAVTDGKEINELIEADSAKNRAYGEENTEK
jgi:hypothetical protein